MIGDDIINYVTYLTVFSGFLPFLFMINRITEKQHKIVLIYFLLGFVTEIVCLFFKSNNNIRSIILNLYIIIEVLLISTLYLYQFTQVYIRFIIKLFCLLFLIFSSYEYIYYKSHYDAFLTISRLETIVILIFSIIYLINKTYKIDSIDFLKDYLFWFNTSFLIYYGIQFFLTLGMPFVDTSIKINIYILGYLNLISCILHNMIFIFGIWKIKKV
jgi:hypothetical protein